MMLGQQEELIQREALSWLRKSFKAKDEYEWDINPGEAYRLNS